MCNIIYKYRSNFSYRVIVLIILINLLAITSLRAVDYRDFAITFGIVKNYTPNPYTLEWSDKDWAYVASYLLYEADKNEDSDFAEFFAPLAPFVSITYESLEGQIMQVTKGDAYCLANYGAGKINFPWFAKILMSKADDKLLHNYKQLEKAVGDSLPEANTIYSYMLPNGESTPHHVCRYVNVVHSLSKENFSKKETQDLLKKAKDIYWSELTNPIPSRPKLRSPLQNKYAKMGSAICMWNDIRHFYPHIEKHAGEWDAALKDFINLACDTSLSNYEYHAAQKKLLSIIDDGHIALWGSVILDKAGEVAAGISDYAYVPAEFDYVDGIAYVKNVSQKDSLRLQKYDIIKRVNGQSVESFIEERKSSVSAATEAARTYKASKKLPVSTKGKAIVCEVERKGEGVVIDTLYANRSTPFYIIENEKKERLKDMGDGVLYYDASVKGKVSKKEIERMNEAKAVIYDLRKGVDFNFEYTLAHMSNDLKIPSYPKVVTHRPFEIGAYEYGTAEKVKSRTPLLTSKAYFLSTHKMISWGETVLQIIKGNNLGTIVGETSAGTNGNATRFYYPIYQLTMTGIRAYNIDGSQFFGIGVKPDIEVIPTFVETAKGRDEILEFTIDMITK